MARDSGGTYTAPSNSFNPAVSGTVIDEADWNTTLTDIETAFTESLYTAATAAVDGQLVRADGTSGVKTQFALCTVNDSGAIHVKTDSTSTAGGEVAISMGSAAMGVYWGSGAPSVSAPKGSLYLRTDGSSSTTRAYINLAGSGTWTALTTAA